MRLWMETLKAYVTGVYNLVATLDTIRCSSKNVGFRLIVTKFSSSVGDLSRPNIL